MERTEDQIDTQEDHQEVETVVR